jgi:hypothetical protein
MSPPERSLLLLERSVQILDELLLPFHERLKETLANATRNHQERSRFTPRMFVVSTTNDR